MSRSGASRRARLAVATLLLTAFSVCAQPAAEQAKSSEPANAIPATFAELAAASGLAYQRPEGFMDAQVEAISLWSYEHAVLAPNHTLEIRYAVRPVARMEIAYDDPHSNAPDPNHIFPMMFQTLVDLLSDSRHTPSREYPQDQARSRFNADWAAAALFDVDSRFTVRYPHALMIAMHKNNLADAYAVYLFGDYAEAKPIIDATLGSLKFLP